MNRTIRPMFLIPVLLIGVFGMPYNTREQSEVLIEGIDIDQSLIIAENELSKGSRRASLGLWALRDQEFSPPQALKVHNLYFRYIDQMDSKFDQWHLAWAISNIYRSGSDLVKFIIKPAYEDSQKRAQQLHRVANRHVNGEAIYRGDIHFFGRHYSRRHLVAPGNEQYLQCVNEYLSKNEISDELIMFAQVVKCK